MLNFFRKNQRIFFIFITAMIVISFTFFGTFSVLPQVEKKKDVLVTKAIDGSKIMQSDVDNMLRILSTSADDMWMSPTSQINFSNDGVLQKDFLATGLAQHLVEQYFTELRPEFEDRLQKMQKYKPYAHPQAPFIQAQTVWEMAKPEILDGLKQAQIDQREASPKTFSILTNLYLHQTEFPAELLRNIMKYQKNQYPALQADQSIERANLSLFGFVSLQDWFGPKFMQLTSQFILNAAIVAEEKGYKISTEEVKADLLKNTFENLKKMGGKENLTYQDAYKAMNAQWRNLGMDEREAVATWQKVMLFRRLFDEVGNRVYLDPLFSEEFASFAKEVATLDMYSLPDEFQVRDFRSMCKLQSYLGAVGSNFSKSSLSLPSSFKSIEEIGKKYPELVERSFQVEYSEVDKNSLASRISLKELWAWQTDDLSWKLLAENFPEVARLQDQDKRSRFAHLSSLEKNVRARLDAFSLEKIVDSNPTWVKEALEKAPVKKENCKIRLKGGNIPFKGFSDHQEMISLLDKAPMKEAKEISDKEREIQDMLSYYSPDQRHYYKISVLSKEEAPHVLTWKEASADDTLDLLLDAQLEESYAILSKKSPALFQRNDGSRKSFSEAKDEIASLYFSDLLQAISEDYKKVHPNEITSGKDLSLDFYAKHRFYKHMREARASIDKNPSDSRYVQNLTGSPLEEQSKLKRQEREVQRSQEGSFASSEVFTLPEHKWSKVEIFPDGKIAFYQVLSRKTTTELDPVKLDLGKKALANDAKKCLLDELLPSLKEKNAISLQNFVEENKE